MCGKLDPTDNAFVQNLGGFPVKKKDPVTSDILIKLCSMYLNSKDLLRIRDLAMILLSFSVFLRFNELSQLRGNDVIVKDCYLIIKISKSKTDQHRDGDEVLISKGVSSACPYTMFRRYVDLSSDMFLLRPLYRFNEKCSLEF
jgi:integrase